MSQSKKAQCPICKKKFDQQHNVVTHLKNNIYPCDHKCRICRMTLFPIKVFKKHMSEVHKMAGTSKVKEKKAEIVQYHDPEDFEEEENEDDAIIEIEPVKTIDYIPIGDFNWEYLESIADDVEKHDNTISETVGISEGEDGKHEVRRVQNIERTTILRFNAEKAKKAIQPEILRKTILVLDQDGSGINGTTALDLLTEVHARREEPRLLTMRAHCVTKKTTDVYSRPPDDNFSEPYWGVQSKEYALATVKAHCVSLTRFLLTAAIEQLEPVLVRDKKVTRPGYMFPLEGLEKIVVALSRREGESNVLKVYSVEDTRNIIAYDENIHKRYREQLKIIWQENIVYAKAKVFESLNGMKLDEREVQIFLEKAKNAGHGFEISYKPKAKTLRSL